MPLHLASNGRAEGFATFDQKMAKRASQFLVAKMVVV